MTHFELARVSLVAGRFREALVGDEVFSGAAVDWTRLAKADRIFVFDQLALVVETWLGAAEGVSELELRSTGVALGEGGARYTLRVAGEEGEFREAPPMDLLEEEQQKIITESLDAIIETVYGLLVIH